MIGEHITRGSSRKSGRARRFGGEGHGLGMTKVAINVFPEVEKTGGTNG